MKGRAKDRKLLAKIRAEFESEAGIVHKYGKNDDEFFFVIGYLKPDHRLNNPQFLAELENCINTRRPNIRLALKVNSVKFVMYQNYSLIRRHVYGNQKSANLIKSLNCLNKTLLIVLEQLLSEVNF